MQLDEMFSFFPGRRLAGALYSSGSRPACKAIARSQRIESSPCLFRICQVPSVGEGLHELECRCPFRSLCRICQVPCRSWCHVLLRVPLDVGEWGMRCLPMPPDPPILPSRVPEPPTGTHIWVLRVQLHRFFVVAAGAGRDMCSMRCFGRCFCRCFCFCRLLKKYLTRC